MKKNLLRNVTLLFLVTFAMVSCAAKQHPAVADARKSYQTAATDPKVRANAPVELRDAQIALNKADEAYKSGADDSDVVHLATLASKRVEIARVHAENKNEEQQLEGISKERTDAVVSAREREAVEARQKALALEASNKMLETTATQNEAEVVAMKEKNDALAKELEALKMKPTPRGLELTLRDTVFEFGKAELTAGAQRDIEKLSTELQKAPERKILVEGHTDGIGSEEYNLTLSQRRAEAIKSALSRNIDSSRITAKGLGKNYPVASNSTEAGRQQNRRVTITVLSNAGTAVQ